MYMRKNRESYETPAIETIVLVVEQCLASSVGTALKDMNANEIYDENF